MTTYLLLTLVVLGLVLAVCLPVLRRLAWRPVAIMGGLLLVLTAVFDSAIVGFGLTVYDPDKILGVYVGAAPVEDFGYTIAALLIMPVLWTALGRARWVARGAGSRPGGQAAPSRSAAPGLASRSGGSEAASRPAGPGSAAGDDPTGGAG